jgi:hypothetical protein
MIWKSKKFWMSIFGVAASLLSHYAGVPEAVTLQIGALIFGYIIAQGLADQGKEEAKAYLPAEKDEKQ